MTYIFIVGTVLIASLFQGATGFGFSILSMAVLPFLLSFKTASVTVLLFSSFFSIQVILRMREYVKLKILLYPVLFGFIGRFFGFQILMHNADNMLRIILGTFLIIFSVFFIFGNSKIIFKPNKINGSVAGFLSGILGGISNISGPPLVIYYLSAAQSQDEYYANANATYFITGVLNIFLHIFYRNIDLQVIKYFSAGMVPITAGLFIGINIFRKVHKKILYSIIYIIMIAMGFKMIFY